MWRRLMFRRKTDPKSGKHTVRACAVEMHMAMSLSIACGNLQENAGPRSRGCAIETHMDMSQEPCSVEIYGKHAAH